jgi:aminopeptidase-like protein
MSNTIKYASITTAIRNLSKIHDTLLEIYPIHPGIDEETVDKVEETMDILSEYISMESRQDAERIKDDILTEVFCNTLKKIQEKL